MKKEETIGGLPKWDVESDLRSIRSAEKVRSDSKRMAAVKILVKQEVGALQKIAGENKEGLGVGVL